MSHNHSLPGSVPVIMILMIVDCYYHSMEQVTKKTAGNRLFSPLNVGLPVSIFPSVNSETHNERTHIDLEKSINLYGMILGVCITTKNTRNI